MNYAQVIQGIGSERHEYGRKCFAIGVKGQGNFGIFRSAGSQAVNGRGRKVNLVDQPAGGNIRLADTQRAALAGIRQITDKDAGYLRSRLSAL